MSCHFNRWFLRSAIALWENSVVSTSIASMTIQFIKWTPNVWTFVPCFIPKFTNKSTVNFNLWKYKDSTWIFSLFSHEKMEKKKKLRKIWRKCWKFLYWNQVFCTLVGSKISLIFFIHSLVFANLRSNFNVISKMGK